MTSLGIFTGYFPGTVSEVAQTVSRLGFRQVQLDLHFPDINLGPGQLTKDKARQVRDEFQTVGVDPVVISGYTNLVLPDAARRSNDLAALREILVHARAFGAQYVVTEAGTRNTANQFMPDPANSSPEALSELISTLRDLLHVAADNGSTLLLEPYISHVAGSVDATVQILDELADDGLRILLDPANFFEKHNIAHMDDVLEDVFAQLGPYVEVVHAKDVALAPEYSATPRFIDIGVPDPIEGHTFRGIGSMVQPAAGLGSLNYELFLTLYRRLRPEIPLVIEHIDNGEPDAIRARSFVTSWLNRVDEDSTRALS